MTGAPLVVYPLVRLGQRVRRSTRREPGGARAPVARHRRGVHRPPHRQGVRRRGARGAALPRGLAAAVSHQPEGHEHRRAAAAADGVSRRLRRSSALMWYGSRKIVERPQMTQGDFLMFVVAAFMMYRPVREVEPRQRQPAAGDRRLGAHLRDARHALRGQGARRGQAAAAVCAHGIEFRDVSFEYDDGSDDYVLRDVSFTRARRPDDRDRRAERRRQDDAGQSDPAVLRRDVGAASSIDGQDIRDVTLRVAARADRHRDAGHGAVRRHHRRQHRLRRGRTRPTSEIEAAARAAHAHEFIETAARGLRHDDRRARAAAVGRAAAAPGDRAGAAEEFADPDPRRGDFVARRRIGAAGAGGAGEPDAEPHRRS